LKHCWRRCSSASLPYEGEVASYIPELSKANPDHFAISIATCDGHLYHAGDFGQRFTIQSISKPFVYGLAR
jgi:glutaminase